jgi:hypothetical protein
MAQIGAIAAAVTRPATNLSLIAVASFIPRLADNDPFDGTRRAAARHRRPASLDRPLRCGPLAVRKHRGANRA